MSTLSFTLMQANLQWEHKGANLSMLEERIRRMTEPTEIVILPEMFSTGFSMKPEILAETMEGETVQWMRKMAKEKKIVLTGSFICEEKINDKKVYHNRLVWMLPNGEYGTYDKRHCFAFAGEDEHYTAGKKRLIASVNGWKINLQICYDLRFPVWSRQEQAKAGEPEYDVLIYVANWPERRSHAWKTLLQARAIENQCYVIGVNRVGTDGNNIHHSGDSMVVDALGEILYTKNEVEDTFTITLDKTSLNNTRAKFPFLRDADHFMITLDDQ